MDKKKSQVYYCLIRSLGQLLSLIRLYKFDHPRVKEKFPQVFTEISKLISDEQSLTFSESAGVFLINGEQVEAKNSLIKRFIKNFNDLKLGSLELESGLTSKEFNIFIQLLTQVENLQGENKLRQYLKEKNVQHIIPLLANYKLVKENEEITKEGGILKVDELSSDVIERFTKDLEKGEVADRFKKEEETYKILAHDPAFLSKLTFDLVKERDGTEELEKEEFEKILWLIGDYMINEIGNARTEKINRKILDEFKVRLLSLWEQEKDRGRWKEEIQKTFAKIGATMELKGLILLYEKHKKGLEVVAGKLKKILETLPPHSRLYQKTREKLKKIGIPHINIIDFK